MKNNSFIKAGLAAILLLGSCSEDSLNKVNPNGGTPVNYYTNEVELTRGVNAVYSMVQSARLVAREWFFLHDLRSDDVASGGGQLEGARNQILTGSLQTSNGVMTDVWNGYYRTIHRANSVIEGSANTQNISESVKNRLLGEARFLRAWAYSDLVILWGAVPLYKVPTKELVESQPKASVDEINAFIISELSEIQSALPATATQVGRITSGAAQALLGRVLMSKGDYAAAKTELEKVKNSGKYKLVANYFDNFREETGFNEESVFEIGYSNSNFNWDYDGNGSGTEGNSRTQEYSAIGWRNLIPSNSLLAEYEKNDPRIADTFYRIGDKYNNNQDTLKDSQVQGNLSTFDGKQQKVSWKKYTSLYKNKETFYTGPMNMRIIRYAEVLLMLAECENEVGTAAAAIDYLNQIRNRPSVSMPDYPTANYPVNSKAEIFKAIMHEKRVELAGEQVRNRDILRWRKQGKLMSEPISYFQANKFELLPIPQIEFSTNASLKPADQNPGY